MIRIWIHWSTQVQPGPRVCHPSHVSHTLPVAWNATFSFLGGKSFLMSFWAAYYATPSPAGGGGGHGISNLLVSFRRPNWKSCLEHMARARSQEKNKGQLLTCVPSQSGPGFLAQHRESAVQTAKWCRVRSNEWSHPRWAVALLEETPARLILQRN